MLDVGSNTVHLLVADTGVGLPLPVHAIKTKLRLAERVDADGRLHANAVNRLTEAVAEAVAAAQKWELGELFGYATAVIRDAPNCEEALAAVQRRASIRLGLLTGVEEAALTFLASRRWMGWRAGPFVPRILRRDDLKAQVNRLARLAVAERAELPGISAPRARQSLAGAVVAHTAMSLLRVDRVSVCPWGLREGILLRRLQSPVGWQDQAGPLPIPAPRPAVPAGPGGATILPIDRERSVPARGR